LILGKKTQFRLSSSIKSNEREKLMSKKIDKILARSSVKLVGVVLILAMLAGIVVMTATAADPPTYGGYNIDGTVPDSETFAVFYDPSGSTAELGPVNSNLTKLGVIHTAPLPMLAYTNPNSQTDFSRIWLDTDTDQYGDLWLYFAWERDSSGTGVIMYEFHKSAPPAACDYDGPEADLIANCNPWTNRAPGDFIIVWDQAGKKINIILRTFYDDGGVLKLDSGVTLTADLAKASYSSNGKMGEAAINLSDSVFPAVPTECISIGNVIPGTVTGNSDTADYKDTVLADFTEYVQISNCGDVKIIKKTDPTGLSGTFPYTLKRENNDPINYNVPPDTSITDTLTAHDDFDLIEDLICATDYQLTEGLVGPAFELQSIVCVVEGETFTLPPTGTSKFPVRPSEITTCTITNKYQIGTLIVKKLVINDNGLALEATDFSFQVNGGTATSFVIDPDQVPANPLMGKNSLQVVTGNYAVTEPAVSGYTTTYSDGSNPHCSNIYVPAGGSATCTITNNDQIALPTGATTMYWQIKDKLTITSIRNGSPAPAATVSFYLYSDDTCSTSAGSSLSRPISAGGEAESEYISVLPGTYYWKAVYTGDQYNQGFTTRCGYEVTTIGETITQPWKQE
jgi:hypothetical protein